MSGEFDWEIVNQEDFQRALTRMGAAVSDFRIPFRLISSDFYRSQRKLFLLSGPGLYEDLNPAYANAKEKAVGFKYPILVRSGKLSKSTLGPRNEGSVFFLGRKELLIGTNIDYGKYHQSDKPRTKMPYRKFVFIDGGPADRSSDSGINGRRERWLNIMNDHVLQIITGEVL